MIREILDSEYNIVEQFIRQDIARNYTRVYLIALMREHIFVKVV